MTLPNFLSLIRLISSPAILLMLYQGQIKIACSLLMLACITDALDGYIARRWNQESNLGKYLDPIADKMLMVSLLTGLFYFHKLHAFLVFTAILRDVCIVVGVLILKLRGKKFAMSPLLSSKISTILQMTLCCLIVVDWGFTLGIPSQIIYDMERIVTVSILYSFFQYVVIWWKIQIK